MTPSRASTEIVYAVRILSLLCGVISGISSRSSMSPGIGTQITPLQWRIVNAISSGVALLAAKIRSPSFSRSSSSTTTTALPAAMSAMARSTGSSRTPTCCGSVMSASFPRMLALSSSFSTCLARTSTSRLTRSPGCRLPRVVRARVSGIRLTVKRSSPGLDDGQADAVDGDRALVDQVARQLGAAARSRRPPSARWACGRAIVADAVDVALHDVAAEPGCRR